MVAFRDVKTVYFSEPVTGFLPVTKRPIVSGIIVTSRRSLSLAPRLIDRLLLHGGRGPAFQTHGRPPTPGNKGQWRM